MNPLELELDALEDELQGANDYIIELRVILDSIHEVVFGTADDKCKVSGIRTLLRMNYV